MLAAQLPNRAVGLAVLALVCLGAVSGRVDAASDAAGEDGMHVLPHSIGMWTKQDVGVWVMRQGLGAHVSELLITCDVDGQLLLDMDDEFVESECQLTHAQATRLRAKIARLVQVVNEMPAGTVDFWTWRAMHLKRTTIWSNLVLSAPRTGIVLMWLVDSEGTLTALGEPEGAAFWLYWLAAPQMLVTRHAAAFSETNPVLYIALWVWALTCFANDLMSIGIAVGAAKSDKGSAWGALACAACCWFIFPIVPQFALDLSLYWFIGMQLVAGFGMASSLARGVRLAKARTS